MTPTQPQQPFENNDEELRAQVARVKDARCRLGLDGLTGDLAFIIINTETERQEAAARDLLAHTGYVFSEAFETADIRTCVLTCPDAADILVQSRLNGPNPFAAHNRHPKSAHLPNTRLETLVFQCSDVARYAREQQKRGVPFMTDDIVETDTYRFIQTAPSALTGNSVGVIEWRDRPAAYRHKGCKPLDWILEKPDRPYLANISTLDHIATRVRAEHRDPAILEFMTLTDYNFAFAIYVPSLNSITNVARCDGARFALVFTSGIRPGAPDMPQGPTEQFVSNYGARAHHLAFLTEDIEHTDRALREDGLGFLSDLVGEEADGIKQSFCAPSPHTQLVNEYIKRYGGFDGFFTPHNVTQLTLATAKQ